MFHRRISGYQLLFLFPFFFFRSKSKVDPIFRVSLWPRAEI
uniref:ORF40g n=1 Tax=Pinus koraiensis TaxID=88728 RepID=A4QM23_PINKO|nr:ORF40g [Pinus koraiensis]ABP35350.1 ORF40g [Pinus koraiensis]